MYTETMNCKSDMNELRRIELNLLKELIRICQKYGLKYYLVGGSCLGAVRHEGFIPWDDDIDVGIPREDYDNFLRFAQSELTEPVFLQTGETDEDYPMNFAKLRDSSTTFVETSLKKMNINHGVYIDVFPLDGYLDSKHSKFMNRLYMRRINCEYFLPNSYGISHKLKNILMKMIYPNYRKVRNKRELLISKVPFSESSRVTNYCGAWGEREIMPREYFGNGCVKRFEGLDVVIPERYDLYLSNLYGDYMKLPPLEKRVPHHYCEIIDLNKSYKEHKWENS